MSDDEIRDRLVGALRPAEPWPGAPAPEVIADALAPIVRGLMSVPICGDPACPYPDHWQPPLIATLERRGVITTNPRDRDECCGLPRDEDGFCTYRPGHPIYVARDDD